MQKFIALFKMMLPLIIGTTMIVALASCGKDDDDSHLAPVGELAPPEWLIGTWGPGGLLANYIITADDVTPTGFLSFKEMAEFIEVFMKLVNAEATVRVKEIKKTDSEYTIGMETREARGRPATTSENYRFRIGDGTFIEVSEFSSEDNRWSEWKRMEKR